VYPGISRLYSKKRPSLGRFLIQVGRLELLAENGSKTSIVDRMRQTIAGFNEP